jgi:MFS family permease
MPRSDEPNEIATGDQQLLVARSMLVTRGLRAVADGLMSTSLATLLLAQGLPKSAVGVVSTVTLLGSATTLLLVTRFAEILRPYRVLVVMSLLMVVMGTIFAVTGNLVVLLLVSMIGPLNPSTGDVSAFLPAEQTIVGSAFEGALRTRAFARFSLVAAGGAAIGSFLAGPLSYVGRLIGFDSTDGLAMSPLAYAAIGVIVLIVYVRTVGRVPLSLAVSSPGRLGPSRRVITELSAIFALDSAGGGMVLYSIIALWMKGRFDFDLSQIGAALGGMSLAAAASALTAPRLSARFGLVETMVVTHVCGNLLLLATAFASTPQLAVACLLGRSLLSQLDVPPRSSFVMSLVTPSERSAAAAFTNLPRSVATASTPILAAWMLQHSSFGWPLVAGALLKLAYDALLWVRFRRFSSRG